MDIHPTQSGKRYSNPTHQRLGTGGRIKMRCQQQGGKIIKVIKMILTNALKTALFDNATQMRITDEMVVQLGNEGITTVEDLVDFEGG